MKRRHIVCNNSHSNSHMRGVYHELKQKERKNSEIPICRDFSMDFDWKYVNFDDYLFLPTGLCVRILPCIVSFSNGCTRITTRKQPYIGVLQYCMFGLIIHVVITLLLIDYTCAWFEYDKCIDSNKEKKKKKYKKNIVSDSFCTRWKKKRIVLFKIQFKNESWSHCSRYHCVFFLVFVSFSFFFFARIYMPR